MYWTPTKLRAPKPDRLCLVVHESKRGPMVSLAYREDHLAGWLWCTGDHTAASADYYGAWMYVPRYKDVELPTKE